MVESTWRSAAHSATLSWVPKCHAGMKSCQIHQSSMLASPGCLITTAGVTKTHLFPGPHLLNVKLPAACFQLPGNPCGKLQGRPLRVRLGQCLGFQTWNETPWRTQDQKKYYTNIIKSNNSFIIIHLLFLVERWWMCSFGLAIYVSSFGGAAAEPRAKDNKTPAIQSSFWYIRIWIDAVVYCWKKWSNKTSEHVLGQLQLYSW